MMMLSKLFLEKERKKEKIPTKKMFFFFFFFLFVFFCLRIFSSIVILDATTHLRVDAEVEWYNSIVATKDDDDDDDDDDASTFFSVPRGDHRFFGVDVRALGGVGDRVRRGIS